MAKLRILIAEDDKITQAVYAEGLPDDSYEKQFAKNGEEALNMYNSWSPDILVLDLRMPVKSGYAVLKETREAEIIKKTAIIIASSMTGREDIIDCAKLGIEGYIPKPFKPSEINEKINSYYKKFKAPK